MSDDGALKLCCMDVCSNQKFVTDFWRLNAINPEKLISLLASDS